MEWTIDTGELGNAGCDAKDLRRVLEDAMYHHAKTAPDAARSAVLRVAHEAFKVDPGFTSQGSMSAMAAAEAARQDVIAKLPAVQEQMKAGIDAACSIADRMGGRVTATVTGHRMASRSDGVYQRISALVDRAAPNDGD